MSRFFSGELKALTPYTPGEQPRDMQYIKLNTNESPFPPSIKAVEYACQAAQKLNLYPDPTCKELVEGLAEKMGVEKDRVILGNGSDELLYFAFSAFCDGKTGAAFPNISYGFYEVFAQMCKVDFVKVPLKQDLSIDITDYFNIGRTVFIANPNAPTGIALPLESIEEILVNNPDNVIVIDEAYVDFGAKSAVELIDKYDNLLVVQTFSKSRAMAGARLGMAMGNKELITDLNTVKYSFNPYNINKMTMAAGLGALADEEYTRQCCETVIENREYTEEKLSELGFVFPKSSSNFIFARHGKIDGEVLYKTLKARGILVRHFTAPEISDYIRITVGAREQMDALLSRLENILEELQ